jgi:uncharacterized oxidoreductase
MQPEVLSDLVRRIFQAAGATEAGARLVADSLVASNLAGHDSHGVIRVRQYLDHIEAGEIDPAAEPAIAHETPTIALVDGKWGFGQIAAHFAIQVLIEKARAHGLAMTGLVSCNHVGRLGEWVQMVAGEALIGLAFCNGGRQGGSVAPFGGAGRALSTNPFAAAVPVAGRPPVVVDFATSTVAEGKLRIARNRGQPIPEGLILDRVGRPTTNPEDYYAGGVLLTAAGHKGYGLALLVDFLGGILTGRGCPALPSFRFGNGVLFVGMATDAFRPAEAFLADAAAFCDTVKAVPPAPGFDEVLLPGEPELRTAERRRAEGISVDEVTWENLRAAAAEFGIDFPGSINVP